MAQADLTNETTTAAQAALQDHWQRNTGLFLAAQNFFLFGSSSVYFAILWYIALQTSSGTWMMLATLAQSLPQILVSLWAGVWADRFNRRNLLMWATGGVTVVTLGIALLFYFGWRDLWLLLLIAAVRSTGSGIEMPVGNALLPQLAPRKELTRMNGLNQLINAVLLLLTPIISGLILGKLGIIFIFVIDVVTAGVGLGLLALIRIAPAVLTEQKATMGAVTSTLKQIGGGLKFTFSHGFMRKFMLLIALAFIMIAPSSQLSTLFVKQTFGSQVMLLTLNELLWTAGATVGGLWISSHQHISKKIPLIALALGVSGVAFFAMGVPEPFYVYLFFMFLSGIAMPIIQATSNILIQETVSTNMMGRVFSIFQIVSTGIYPLAMLFFGPLADVISIKWIFMASGIALVAVAWWFNTSLKQTGIDQ
ncbi:MFS transporter [Furfurilactobacillus siliginis]|uniref:MFS transporter n=1 Tax=Furfurilactobacillus siliginis TaxID=348151 RepID=A0A0R2L3E7_9LACO|nr:MFS transporter [Furfurilactobacillus siliginis]KRN96142.1 multidrug resistance protein [Furfurilactobacillus siliginis]GEK27934.1 MFS transporter [Furfurilactobacillus siliginis]